MIKILDMLLYHMYYDYSTDTAYIDAPVKVKHMEEIRVWLICSGYKYKNIIIGKPDL